jgi:hypothetical protein
MIEPIIKPIGNAFKLGFDIISPALAVIGGEAGEMFSALFDGLAALINLSTEIVKIGIDVIKFSWDNSATKKAIDAILWVWQNKDNVTRGAQGYADFLTFNLFDFDKQNKKAIGGPVVVPMMAAGGIIGTDSPEVMGLKNAGSSIVATTISTLNRLGIVGNFVKTALAPQFSVYSNLFGIASVGLSGDRLASQVRTPSGDLNIGSQSSPGADNSKVRALIGEGQVTLLTAQPKDGFSPQNQKTTRGLLADIYNAFATAKFGGTSPSSSGNPAVGSPGSSLTAADLQAIKASSADKRAAAHLSTLEASAPQHVADVYQVILNRASKQSGGIPSVITAKEQFSPYSAALYGSSADGAASSKYGSLKLTKKELFELAGKPDGIQQLTKRFQAGNPSVAAKVLADFEMNGPLSQSSKKFVGGAQYFMGYKVTSVDRRRSDGGNWIRDKYAVGGVVQLMANGGKYDPSGVPDWYDNAETRHARRTKRAKGAKKFAVGGLLSLGGSNAPGGDRKLTGNSTFANTHLHHNEPDSSSHNKSLMGYGFGSPRDYVLTRGPQSMDRGTPIVAGANGKVKVLGGSMNIVELYDPSGKKLGRFLHNDKILVKDGQTVGPNTVIATQGSAGGNWPVHVHLEGSSAFQTNWIRASLGNKNLADVQGSDAQTSPSGTGGTGGKSLLEGEGASDEFQSADMELKKALELWASAFGGSTTSTATAVSPTCTTFLTPFMLRALLAS